MSGDRPRGRILPNPGPRSRAAIKPDGVTPYSLEELPAALALAGETVSETEIFVRNEQCPAGIWIAAQANPLRNEAEKFAAAS